MHIAPLLPDISPWAAINKGCPLSLPPSRLLPSTENRIDYTQEALLYRYRYRRGAQTLLLVERKVTVGTRYRAIMPFAIRCCNRAKRKLKTPALRNNENQRFALYRVHANTVQIRARHVSIISSRLSVFEAIKSSTRWLDI